MTIHNIQIHKSNWNGELVCSATIMSKDWRYCNNIVHWSEDNRWAGDYNNLSDNQKKLCRKAWYKLAKTMNIKRKELNIIIGGKQNG